MSSPLNWSYDLFMGTPLNERSMFNIDLLIQFAFLGSCSPNCDVVTPVVHCRCQSAGLYKTTHSISPSIYTFKQARLAKLKL